MLDSAALESLRNQAAVAASNHGHSAVDSNPPQGEGKPFLLAFAKANRQSWLEWLAPHAKLSHENPEVKTESSGRPFWVFAQVSSRSRKDTKGGETGAEDRAVNEATSIEWNGAGAESAPSLPVVACKVSKFPLCDPALYSEEALLAFWYWCRGRAATDQDAAGVFAEGKESGMPERKSPDSPQSLGTVDHLVLLCVHAHHRFRGPAAMER